MNRHTPSPTLTSSLSILALISAACVGPFAPKIPQNAAAAEPAPAAPAATAAAPAAEPAGDAPTAARPPEPATPSLGPWKHGENPFVGARYWTDPYAPAGLKAKLLSQTDPEQSKALKKIADNGGADWIGEWTPNVGNWIAKRVTAILKTGSLPLFIAYHLPKRDCGQYSAGGLEKADEYKTWISAFAKGIADRRAVVVLEPDALGHLKKEKCLSEADQKERLELLRFAIKEFMALKNTAVYLDAGHSGWLTAPDIAERLKLAGIADADGFALNVSNYKATETEIKYGKEVSKLVGGKHFIIDTSRNGNGPPKEGCKKADDEACWCNPAGRALGSPPTHKTADPLVDAYLWLKKPGESDGQCNGGPKAGVFWLERAVELAKNAKY